jgi:hypothetical protein
MKVAASSDIQLSSTWENAGAAECCSAPPATALAIVTP